jgi:hypothetical protein
VNLTLFPVAALLLLLSGMGTPSHASGESQTTAAFLREIFRASPAGGKASLQLLAKVQVRQNSTVLSRGTFGSGFGLSMAHVTSGWATGLRIPHLATASRALGRKQYRTRFGFANGAYLALGPPADLARAGQRWI